MCARACGYVARQICVHIQFNKFFNFSSFHVYYHYYYIIDHTDYNDIAGHTYDIYKGAYYYYLLL